MDADCDTFRSFKSDIDGKVYQYITYFRKNRIKFLQPVYIQRYNSVCAILKKEKWNRMIRVVDFGCNTMTFFQYLKNLPFVEEIFEIDVDKQRLLDYCCVVEPSYYRVNWSVNRPLRAMVLCGSIAEKDVRIRGVDVIVCIELIEHLYEKELNEIPGNIFGYIKPKTAIFTTPNYEFNVLFNGSKSFPNGDRNLRHEDHKFEWTRQEFDEWANNIIKVYPEYTVKFYGIGPAPEGSEHLGFCSQMAVFQRNDDPQYTDERNIQQQDDVRMPYMLVTSYEFIWWDNNLTDEEHILKEMKYRMRIVLRDKYNRVKSPIIVRISDLMPRILTWCQSETDLKKIIRTSKLAPMKKIGKSAYAIVINGNKC